MNYTALFNMNTSSTEDCRIQHTKNYDFWMFIVSKVLRLATDFEIRCWPGELYAFEIGVKYGEQVINIKSQEIVYRGKIIQQFVSDVTTNFLNENKTLKWFTISFSKNGKDLFCSEHYGTELFLHDVTEFEKPSIQKLADQYNEVYEVVFFPYKD